MRTFPLIDGPSPEHIDVAMRRLQRIGALDKEERITEMGEQLAEIPFDPGYARALIAAQKLGVLSETILATAGLENEGIFHIPKRDAATGYSDSRAEAAAIRKKFAGESGSDFTAMVQAYRAYKEYERALLSQEYSRSQRNQMLRDWCTNNFINIKRLNLMSDKVVDIQAALNRTGLEVRNINTLREFDSNALTKALAAGLVDNVARKEGKFYTSPSARSFYLSNSSVCSDTEPFILAAAFTLVPTRRSGFSILGTNAAPLKPEWLAEVMPQLCAGKRIGNHSYDLEKDMVVETEKLFYADLELSERTVASAPLEAAAVFARYLANNQTKIPENLREVVQHMHRQKERARKLNERAGVELFPYASNKSLEQFILETIPGIARASDIADPNVLRLPALDETLAAKVERDNPEEIEYMGKKQSVYYGDENPYLSLDRSIFSSGEWRNIPDHTMLPSGREIHVYLDTGIRSGTIRGTGRFVKDTLEFHELREKAENVSQALKRARSMYERGEDSKKIEPSIWSKLFDKTLSPDVPAREAIPHWMKQAEALLAAVEKSASSHEEREVMLNAAQARGEILRDFSAYVRRGGSNQGDGWVIAHDGSLRKADMVDTRHPPGFQYSHKIWKQVGQNELALVWKDGVCEIAHRAPGYEPTPAQLARVREIEREVGLPEGSFGLDVEALAKNAERVKSVIRALENAGIIQKNRGLDLPWSQLGSNEGIDITYYINRSRVDKSRTRDPQVNPRRVIFTTPAAEGVAEIIHSTSVSGKTDYYNVRWRVRNPEDTPSVPPAEKPTAGRPTKEALNDMINKLKGLS